MAHSFFWRRAAAGLRHRMPGDCPLCGGVSRGSLLCSPCGAQVCRPADRERTARCPRCALPIAAGRPCFDCLAAPPAFSRAIVAFDYLSPGDMFMRAFKSSGDARRADAFAALLAAAMVTDGIVLPADSVLMPIPASAAGLRRRGFNPAGEIARALAWRLRVPVKRSVLRRTREGGQQSARTREARLRAGVGLFVAQGRIDASTVVLVDDVMTTGSTLDAAARALQAQGVATIVALAAARAVR